MGIGNVIVLAILQGITEFLPISSSGHLVLAQNFLGLKNVPVLFSLILHLGTVSATIIVYYKIIGEVLKDGLLWIIKSGEARERIYKRGNAKLLLYIIISTIITGIAGMLFKDTLKGFFYKPVYVSLFLFLTGIILLITRCIAYREKNIGEAGLFTPIIIGCSQAFSMLPGISRSGSTIATGLYIGLSRGLAGTYSFLLSIPSILGASLIEFAQEGKDLQLIAGDEIGESVFILGISAFLISLVTGYLALRFLLSFLHRGKLHSFCYYCFAVAIGGLILSGS